MLWNGVLDILEILHHQADVDIGGPGTGLLGIPVTESKEQAAKLPYAVRYLKCAPDRKDLCDEQKYNGRCWVHRPDVTPPVKQGWGPGSGGSHHPGFRTHQLLGRVLAFTILTALQEGLTQWKDSPDYALPDSAWHVSAHYQNIRNKLAKLTTTPCFNDTTIPTPRLCTTPMKGVSEYTPRANPKHTSIRSIMTDTTYIRLPPGNIYLGPDVYNPALEPPEGQVNYLAIIENDVHPPTDEKHIRRQLRSSNVTDSSPSLPLSTTTNDVLMPAAVISQSTRHRQLLQEHNLTIGRGWALHISKDDVPCNGTYDSECGRTPTTACLLSGQNDGKGGLVFDSLSGWLLLRFKVQHGIIMIKLETWLHGNHKGGWTSVESSELTEGWTKENNKGVLETTTTLNQWNNNTTKQKNATGFAKKRKGVSSMAPALCPEFRFQFAINGQIQSWTKEEFLRKRLFLHWTVEAWTLLDDPTFSSGNNDGTEVILGIRMQGCKRLNSMKLTHVFWA